MEENLKQIGKYVVNLSRKLGEGSQGTSLYECYEISKPDIPLAVKKFDMEMYQSDHSEEIQQMLKREKKIIKSIKSPYVVEIKDIFRTANNIYIFQRFANNGDLQQKLKNSPNKRLPEKEAMKYFAQLVEGYKALYKNNMIHRDIKPSKVLIDGDTALLADFVCKIKPKKRILYGILGTPYYRTPQLLFEMDINHIQVTNKCDVWSMGIMLYKMLSDNFPWSATTIPDYDKVIRSKPLQFQVELSPDVKDLVTGMLQIEESQRFSWEQVFKHPAIVAQNIPPNPE